MPSHGWSQCLASDKVAEPASEDPPFKPGPRDWLRQPAGAAAPSGGSEPHAVGSVGATFQWPLRVYWEDTDAGGIVFYANYLKFFERSRTEWLRSLGIGQQALREATGGMFVVAETRVRYLCPARLDDELIVTAKLIETGRASMTIAQQALLKSAPLRAGTPASGDTPALLCEGTIRIGWVDALTMTPARIPASILQSLKDAS
jgi:acyl-CoA thioester hydrolase